MTKDPIVIISASRTPLANFQGIFKEIAATELGSIAICHLLNTLKLDTDLIDEVIMGCVLPAGLGQGPARQASLGAGLSNSVGATTINKLCGSGMKAVMLASVILQAQQAKIIIAGGMENMSKAPYLLPEARNGYRLGHNRVVDHMFFDGLEDAYEKGTLMGVFAEACAEKFKFTRQMQDTFALTSYERAKKATETGKFKAEIAPITLSLKEGQKIIHTDESLATVRPEKIPLLKPAFKKDGGTITAANASSIADGAAALLLMRRSTADQQGLTPIAVIEGMSSHAQAPNWFTTAPVTAIKKLLNQINWSTNEVDLYEINEAFAVVTMAALQELQLPHEKVNIHGGACSLGHPIGASGARILVTLIHALRQYGLKKGIASLCIGGGEATAMAITIPD